MRNLTRRQFCGSVAVATLAGCTQPQPADLPLPMGPPLDKLDKSDRSADTPAGDVPETFQVKLETTQGDVLIEVHRDWSPHGAARFYELVKIGFYDDCRFFRVIPGFMVQWGIHGDPKVMDEWRDNNIPDDRPTGENRQSNRPGMVTFAKAGFPNSRSTQIFVNYVNNASLDQDGFTPFGKVLSGMEALEALNAKYGGKASDQQPRIQKEGNAFLDKAFPGLDSIKRASFVETDGEKPAQDTPPDDSESKDGGNS